MTNTEEGSAVKPQPAFWYDIPHGYVQLDVYPSAEHMQELARQILALPDDVRERADQVFRLYAVVMWEMQKHRVQGCALGLHPDDAGGAAMSVLTVSSVEMQGVDPKAALVKLMVSGAGETQDSRIVPVELPSGPGFVTDSVHRATVPGAPPDEDGLPASSPVWRGMVAIPDTRNSAVIAVQLVTPSVELADDYRNVLLGVARTVTFTDPRLADGAAGTAEPEPGTAAHAVRSDFG
ncbi:hypothetical protein G4Z16_07380 [Streptomyces bathyalis]|uniref:Uncharacterized protein n=1 Tax=Streptomyces bathyalis TaxID=2710756 RepID=A0A7T1T4I0_9ACTN|nr:hypothetical protein [Streptomyces bathyalis]QPP06247.1 hypothetical protein G4Z16_07380 [Streptomyces bathyalis]